MGRKTQITREMILEAAFEILDEAGIGAVAIKNIAARLNCSTQPVSWQFGSMQELKKELFDYAAHKLYDPLQELMDGREAGDAFFLSGMNYITGACEHPNVFRFVNVDNPSDLIGDTGYGERSIFTIQFDEVSAKMIAAQYGLPPEAAGELVRDTVIYTHGLATMMMYDNFRLPTEEACKMMYNMGIKLMNDSGIKPDIDYKRLMKEFWDKRKKLNEKQ